MPRSASKRATRGLLLLFLFLTFIIVLRHRYESPKTDHRDLFHEHARPEMYPVPPEQRIKLPRTRKPIIPPIQHKFAPETSKAKAIRVARLAQVKGAFEHAWKGYKKSAWAQDELRPLAGGFKTPFCGWAATLVDSLDTLLIMGLDEEFAVALEVVKKIDFKYKEGCQINLFETTIRHLGGLLSAWDLSGGKHPVLMEKAVELAEVLYAGFDTPNRMPAPHFLWSWNNTELFDHEASRNVVVAVLGSLQLEFTRLSQITGNDKYYDAVQRIINELEAWQPVTQLPGMWPTMVDCNNTLSNTTLTSPSPDYGTFTLGALADSAYEYLPKQYMMLGGRLNQYRRMYESFIEVAKKHLFFRPMTLDERDILISGTANRVKGQTPTLIPDLQHLTCFTGGMLAIAGKIFSRPDDVEIGRKLTDGCVWAYQNTPTGIMPETILAVPCANVTHCPWDQNKWWNAISPGSPDHDEATIREIIASQKLVPGFAKISDARYLLRPEAIESVFIMYRVTGEQYWMEAGWKMFKSIVAATKTDLAHGAIENVMDPIPEQVDEMESFWLAETLKYFYLLFSETDVVDLDEYVLNTEAHPLRRPIQ